RPNSAHVVLGNQHFYTAPAFELLTPEEINQRLALIEELKAVTGDPAALKRSINPKICSSGGGRKPPQSRGWVSKERVPGLNADNWKPYVDRRRMPANGSRNRPSSMVGFSPCFTQYRFQG